MPRLTRFEEYRDRYPDFALEKTDDGILLHEDAPRWRSCGLGRENPSRHRQPLQRRRGRSRRPRRDLHRDRRHVQRELGRGSTSGPRSRPGRVGGGDGMVRKAPAPQPARDRRHHDRGGERPLQHPFRAGADVRRRARFRRRLLPGHGPFPAEPLARRRHPEHLAAGHGPQSLALRAADGPEDHGPDGARVGRGQRGAAEGRADGSRLGDRQVSPAVLADRPAPYAPNLRSGVQEGRGQRSRLRADAWSSWA